MRTLFFYVLILFADADPSFYTDESEVVTGMVLRQLSLNNSTLGTLGKVVGNRPYRNTTRNSGLFGFVKHLGIKRIYCIAPRISRCPTTLGASDWAKDGKIYSENEIPDGSKWYMVVNNITVYCTAQKKSDCPAIPGPQTWVIVPANLKLLCQTEDQVVCGVYERNFWHKISSLTTTTEVKANDDTKEHGVIPPKTTEYGKNKTKSWVTDDDFRPSISSLTTVTEVNAVIPPKSTEHGQHKNKSSITGNGDLSFRTWLSGPTTATAVNANNHTKEHAVKPPKTNEQEKNKTTSWVMIIGDSTIYCNSQDPKKCPKVRGQTGIGKWKPNDRNEHPNDAKFEMMLGETPMLCSGPIIESCPIFSEASVWHPRAKKKHKPTSRDGQNNTKSWVTNIGDSTIYCDSQDQKKCPKVSGPHGIGKWRPANSNGHPDDAKFEIVLGETPIVCRAPTIDKCPILSNSSQWHPKAEMIDKPKRVGGQGNTKLWGQNYTTRGTTGVGKLTTGNTSDSAIWVDKFENATVYCSSQAVHDCWKLTRMEGWQRVFWVSTEKFSERLKGGWLLGDAPIICIANNNTECPKISNAAHWRPAKSENLDEVTSMALRVMWVMYVGNASIYCPYSNTKKCPEIVSTNGSSRWRAESARSCSSFEAKVDSTVFVCVAETTQLCPKLSPNIHWHVKIGKYGKLCKSIHEDAETPKTMKTDVDFHGTQEGKSVAFSFLVSQGDNRNVNRKRWINTIGNATIYCQSLNNQRCPTFKAAGVWKLDGTESKQLPPYGKWHMSWKGVNVSCDAAIIDQCPRDYSNETQWVPNNGLKEHSSPEKDRHKIHVGPVLTKREHKMRKDRKKPNNSSHVDLPTSEKMGRWMKWNHQTHIYCDAKKFAQCPVTHGGLGWKKVEHTDKPPNGTKWLVTLKDSTIYCDDQDISMCPQIRGKTKWIKLDTESGSRGKWVNKIGNHNFYCDTEKVINCPKIKGGSKWDPWDECIPLPRAVKWAVNRGGTNITCDALNVTVCNDAFDKSLWFPVKSDNTVSVLEPKGRWVKQNSKIYCDAQKIEDCSKEHGGKDWKPVANASDLRSPPKDSKWQIRLTDSIVFHCGAMLFEQCPKINGSGSWEAVILKNIWVTKNGKIKFYCESSDVKKCPTVVGGGPWNQLSDYSNKVGKWDAILGDTKIYCDAENRSECSKGFDKKPWCEIKKEGVDSNKNDKHNSETLTPILETTKQSTRKNESKSVRHDNSTNHEVVRFTKYDGHLRAYCDAESVSGCPAGPGDWTLLKGPYVIQNFPDGVKWLADVDNNTIYCSALLSQECMAIYGDTKKWKPVILSSNKNSRWVKQLGDTKIYCDAKDVRVDCPKIPKSGEWRFVGAVGQVNRKPKDCQWTSVLDSAHVFCSALDIEGCSKKWEGPWKKVHTRIFCDTRDVKVCPALYDEGKWVRVKQISNETAPPEGSKWKITANDWNLHCFSENSTDCPQINAVSLWHRLS